MMTSRSRVTFQTSDVIFIFLDISNFEKKTCADYLKYILYPLCYLFYLLKSWLRIKNNKDIKAFQIKIDEQTHRIQISQLADDTTPKMRYILLWTKLKFVSGLLPNRNKTERLGIGKLKHSKDKVDNISWKKQKNNTVSRDLSWSWLHRMWTI